MGKKLTKEDLYAFNFENLANAVVLQAVHDYRRARATLRRGPDTRAIKNIIELKKFFLSDSFNVFSTLDGATVWNRLEKEENAKNKNGKDAYQKTLNFIECQKEVEKLSRKEK